METRNVTLSLGLSLPITIICGIIAYNVGKIEGKLETYRELAQNKNNNEKE